MPGAAGFWSGAANKTEKRWSMSLRFLHIFVQMVNYKLKYPWNELPCTKLMILQSKIMIFSSLLIKHEIMHGSTYGLQFWLEIIVVLRTAGLAWPDAASASATWPCSFCARDAPMLPADVVKGYHRYILTKIWSQTALAIQTSGTGRAPPRIAPRDLQRRKQKSKELTDDQVVEVCNSKANVSV